MNTQSAENRIWLQERLRAAGLTEPLAVLAAQVAADEPRHPSPWSYNYCRAYSDGHNNRGLGGKRLDHFASAYADICEEVDTCCPELEMTLEAFWLRWNEGVTFEGTATEHWYLA